MEIFRLKFYRRTQIKDLYRLFLNGIIILCFLPACSMSKVEPQAIYRSHSGLDGSLSHNAETRSVHIMNRKDKYKFCGEPAPDVGTSKEDGFSLSLNFLNFGGNEKEEIEKDTEDLPLTGRTGYVMLARELAYRLCESAINYKMDFEQFKKVYELNIAALEEVATIEATNSKYAFSTGIDESINVAMSSSIAKGGGEGQSFSGISGGSGDPKNVKKLSDYEWGKNSNADDCQKYNKAHKLKTCGEDTPHTTTKTACDEGSDSYKSNFDFIDNKCLKIPVAITDKDECIANNGKWNEAGEKYLKCTNEDFYTKGAEQFKKGSDGHYKRTN